MSVVIPTNSNGSSTLNIQLGATTYLMRTYYNFTLSMWYLDLSELSGTILAQGVALVPNANLLKNFPRLTQSFGELRVIDITGEGNATSTSLGDTAQLLYYEPGEFEESYPDYGTFEHKPLPYVFNNYFETT